MGPLGIRCENHWDFIKKSYQTTYLWQYQRKNLKTYVYVEEDKVVAYFSFILISLENDRTKGITIANLLTFPVPLSLVSFINF